MKKINDNDEILVFTDGSCSNNGFSNAKAGIGVYFSEDDSRNVSKKIEGKQTNNTAELSAIIEVFKICSKDIEDGKSINFNDQFKMLATIYKKIKQLYQHTYSPPTNNDLNKSINDLASRISIIESKLK